MKAWHAHHYSKFEEYSVLVPCHLTVKCYLIMEITIMTFAKSVSNANQSNRLLGGKLIVALIIVLVATFVVGAWFFSISSLGLGVGITEKYLPPNCYSINGNQICPIHKS